MAKKLIHFTAQFQGSIEVDTNDYEDWSDDDIISDMTHEQLFAACETDLSLDVDHVEAAE
jgi:hypothetical protein